MAHVESIATPEQRDKRAVSQRVAHVESIATPEQRDKRAVSQRVAHVESIATPEQRDKRAVSQHRTGKSHTSFAETSARDCFPKPSVIFAAVLFVD